MDAFIGLSRRSEIRLLVRSRRATEGAACAGYVSADKARANRLRSHQGCATAGLTGQEPPRFENDKQTMDDLKGRTFKTIEYVQRARSPDLERA
jgi:hypothetical protein